MSKELEALERIKDDIEIGYLSTKHDNQKDKENYLVMLDTIETELKRLKELEDNFNNLNEFYFNLWYLTEALKSKKYAKNLAIEFVDDKFCLTNSKTGTIYEIVDDVKGLKVGYKAHQKQEKSLKTLEIIKNKQVNVQELFDFIKKYGEHNGLYMYNGHRPYGKRINEEEFNLLKEVLL